MEIVIVHSDKLKLKMKRDGHIWIVKPPGASCGNGIKLVTQVKLAKKTWKLKKKIFSLAIFRREMPKETPFFQSR